MNIRRIFAVVLQEYFITSHSLEVIIDLFIFPLINIVIFGLLSFYLAGTAGLTAAHYVLMGMVLWQVNWVISYSIAVGSLWNIWSHNLSNMFIAPLKLSEYILAHFLSGIVKAIVLLLITALLAATVFHFDVFSIGLGTVVLVFGIFAIFSFSLGVAVLGLIFRYGNRLAALGWSTITIFQPLSAAFFPVSVMPHALQIVAYCLPPTYAFEAARSALGNGVIDWHLFVIGFALDLVYCVLCILFFRHMFKKSRESGQFARNDS